ncbi:MAG: hypothetical protein R3C18_16740 [Planctomycetaceae bacterium]
MLEMPKKGFQPSVEKHNVSLPVLCDWIEACVAFSDEAMSVNDFVDVLHENSIYHDQSMAHEMLSIAWSELDRRSRSMGDGTPFRVHQKRITASYDWKHNPAYSFCLLLGAQVIYKEWARQFGSDFTEQGTLFEELTAAALEAFGWDVLHTGWSKGNTGKIKDVVEGVCIHVGEPQIEGMVEKWISEYANEEQLDIVCTDPYFDGLGGRALFLFQCASGGNWTKKLHTPDPRTWMRIIDFTTSPQRGFSMPFGLPPKEFTLTAGKVDGIFLDRYRLQSPAYDGDFDWLPGDLKSRLVSWMKPRISALSEIEI